MESQTNAGTTTALIQNLTNGTLFSLDRPELGPTGPTIGPDTIEASASSLSNTGVSCYFWTIHLLNVAPVNNYRSMTTTKQTPGILTVFLPLGS